MNRYQIWITRDDNGVQRPTRHAWQTFEAEDWDAAKKQAARLFNDFIALPTTNPLRFHYGGLFEKHERSRTISCAIDQARANCRGAKGIIARQNATYHGVDDIPVHTDIDGALIILDRIEQGYRDRDSLDQPVGDHFSLGEIDDAGIYVFHTSA